MKANIDRLKHKWLKALASSDITKKTDHEQLLMKNFSLLVFWLCFLASLSLATGADLSGNQSDTC